MFWAVFLIGNGESVTIYPFDNQLTTFFGYLLFASFHIGNITILLNMLIAMMSRSYETIQVNTLFYIIFKNAEYASTRN